MTVRRTTAALVAGAAAYLLLIRPWQLRWGATREEARAPMPGDEIAPRAHLQATRAITIDAPPKEVWPWLVQMGGYTRAGWYSYDRIDNAGRPSAGRIVPELQDLQVGDVMPTAPDGSGFTVERIDPPSTLVLSIHAYEGTVSCCVTLRESGDGSRLVLRLRVRARPTLRGLAFLALMETGDFVMMRKQLLTIRARAEGAAS
ncbi:hypothetical protein [Nonomuraea gerenzanensis]|uniref:SRPBCC family protein n=1 Tax=Nonomuraea gerenzanensis TaxID=93944 RepID=A0A1M4EBD8_9ACTN|nr:hypothetical protein [Nonomuraea gerenzanensis]UBU18293.1 hypothetical protein LCN96_25700 [Nonomuraea gerenzanensis]SBO96114.1 hypothetical protein BN4615_P5630 [Nonomuraea gerenzanensis]